MLTQELESVGRAFSRQSSHFDEDDLSNPILQDLRKQVYEHVERFLQPESRILELNAGTGLDAQYFVSKGHSVHGIDISDGMIEQHRKKIALSNLNGRWSAEKLSFTDLKKLHGQKFDYVFSNFGGLNCIPDLGEVAKTLPDVMKPGGIVTFVIMPPVCPWELLGIFKGNRSAFRRLNGNGVMAHLEGEHFRTWYHSLSSIKKAMSNNFKLIASEGLAALLPPPHLKEFPRNHPTTYKQLRILDSSLRNYFPFNRWADHLVVSFRHSS